MKKFKIIALILSLILAIGLFGACGKKQENNSNEDKGGAEGGGNQQQTYTYVDVRRNKKRNGIRRDSCVYLRYPCRSESIFRGK